MFINQKRGRCDLQRTDFMKNKSRFSIILQLPNENPVRRNKCKFGERGYICTKNWESDSALE